MDSGLKTGLQESPQLGSAIEVSDIASLGMSLVFVIAAILIVGWLYSKIRNGSGAGSELINVVASRPLGPKERLLIVEIADQQLLLGMTAAQVQTLHIFESPVVTDKPRGAAGGFSARLRKAVKEIAK